MSEAPAPLFPATILPAPPARTARQRWALPGGSHDRIVTLLRIVLPAGIGVLAAFLVMAPLSGGGDVSFVLDKNKVEVAHERLRIQAARYRGQDGKGQPFTLDAGSAVQKSSTEPIVQIRTLAATLRLADGPATIRANRGRYDMGGDKVAIVGPVRVDGPHGYRLDTHDATLDLKTRRMASGGAAGGTLPNGVFSADHLDADLDGRDVRLDGHARLRIVPRGAK
ncbi:LPS export ABC transporter periplasmic protein LptC [Sphingomonas bacterium]|uniref:LPS export ABC transporter periplasmic protein LptC n=1 Tax=Sphingomonas bacterium TaxID=1895847 RepID=UPI0020C6C30E|nr:LPS export ABC transporter periplasmic protein LptC [Sphingomonas bacterium]